MKNRMKLDEVFDLPIDDVTVIGEEPTYQLPAEIEPDEPSESVNEFEHDFQETRESLKHILERGGKALDAALDIVDSEESPKAVEAISSLLKTLADVNTQLMDIHAKKKQILQKTPDKSNGNNITHNNAVFVGTTKELMALFKQGELNEN